MQLEAVLERHVGAVVGSVDHWTGQETASKRALKELYNDYMTIAAAAGLRIPDDASQTVLVAQMTAILSTYAWNEAL